MRGYGGFRFSVPPGLSCGRAELVLALSFLLGGEGHFGEKVENMGTPYLLPPRTRTRIWRYSLYPDRECV
jgi:hypothetical protein